MDRNTILPSGRAVSSYLYDLYRDGCKTVRSIVSVLLSDYSVSYEEDFNGLACMNHDTKTIIINPLEYLALFDPYVDIIKAQYPDKWYTILYTTLSWGLVGVAAHEMGHAKYTPPFSDIVKLISSSQTPEFFLHFCVNVVEDSYIQNRMKEQYKWDLLRDGINTSTSLLQGLTTCEDFMKKEKFTPHDKMFYFILRSYNSFFAPPEGCDIPDELIEEFLSFYFINDNILRTTFTISWADKVYAWLKDEIEQEEPPKGPSGGDGNGPSVPGDGPSVPGNSQGNKPCKGSGIGNGPKKTKEEIEQAIKDIVDSIQKKTGVGSGNEQNQGSFDSSSLKDISSSEVMSISNGIFSNKGTGVEELNDDAKQRLSDFNTNFQRIQSFSFNGIEENLSSGRLMKRKLYKSSFTPKIFSRETGIKREMDLYLGVTLDASGSMDDTYYTLVDIVVPLLHSLERINAKSEMLVFSDNTVKVKDYYDKGVSTLYCDTHNSNMSCGTDLLPSLRYFSSVIRERNHKDKCILVITDGATSNKKECIEIISKLKQLNTCVVGIGLRLGGDARWFTELFGEDSLMYPTEESIKENIAKDLISYLSKRFMRR